MCREPNQSSEINPKVLLELSLGQPIGQLRAAPVCLGKDHEKAIIATYCADFDVDPYHEMFFFPTDTLKMVLFDVKGNIIWKRDLGKGVVPGMWFCPVLPFDLDGDGVDEIWYVNNVNVKHPLGLSGYRLERIDALSGQTTGQWQWPNYGGRQVISHAYRNFIMGGYVKGQPVLVCAQGTYGDMFLQAWNPGMVPRWSIEILKDQPGARGSHMCPVVDINHDGIDELMWGERCIELDKGRELFCADRDSYKGHSDAIQPVFDRDSGRWFIYTARESDFESSPRVNLYNDRGERVWGKIDRGHMDMSWVARIGEGGRHVAMSISIDHKTCGPDGRFHYGRKEYVFDALTGEELTLPFSTYGTRPVDINGDGIHEFVGDGKLFDRTGKILGEMDGTVAMASHFTDHPGEQILCFQPDGTIRIWADENARDSEFAKFRYEHPFYVINNKLSSSGWNATLLAGL